MWWRTRLGLALTGALAGCTPVRGADQRDDRSLARARQALSAHQVDLVASDGAANDDFGYSVALSGNRAVVGTPWVDDERGAAYVFVREGGEWTEEQRLVPDPPVDLDWFGLSVAIDGDTVIVGAPQRLDEIDNAWPSGRAVVFEREDDWVQKAVLTSSPRQASDWFGYSVALAGDAAVVGAPFYDVQNGARDQGAAFVFERSGGAWSRTQSLTSTDGASGDTFGRVVAIDGDIIVLGAPQDDEGLATDRGSAHVFVRSGASFLFEQKLTVAGDGATKFGSDVAVAGTSLIVTAGAGTGGAHVFELSGSSFEWQAELLTLPGTPWEDVPPSSVALSGNSALVGVAYDKAGTSVTQGAAYRFVRDGSRWSFGERFLDENEGANRLFGTSVASSSTTALVGAPGDTVGENTAQGAVHVFALEPAPPGAGGAAGTGGAAGGNAEAGDAGEGGAAGEASASGGTANGTAGTTSQGGEDDGSGAQGGSGGETSTAGGSANGGRGGTNSGASAGAPGSSGVSGSAGGAGIHGGGETAGESGGTSDPGRADAGASEETEGCGCRVAPQREGGLEAAWFLALGCALRARRRKSLGVSLEYDLRKRRFQRR